LPGAKDLPTFREAFNPGGPEPEAGGKFPHPVSQKAPGVSLKSSPLKTKENLPGNPAQHDDRAASDGESLESATDVEPTHIASIDHTEDEGKYDKSWDPVKAETMASVLKEEGSFDHVIEDHELAKHRVEQGGPPNRPRLKDIESLVDAQEDVNRFAGPPPEKQARALEKAEATLRGVDEANANYLSDSAENIETTVGTVLSPFEELYDTNPTLFAKMPTEEFMEIAKNLNHISREADSLGVLVDRMQSFETKIAKGLEKAQPLSGDDREVLIATVANGTGMSQDKKNMAELGDKFDAAALPSFEKSPRQVLESYKALVGEYQAQIKARKAEADEKRQAFLDKYKLAQDTVA
jgi:hypothetical protein